MVLAIGSHGNASSCYAACWSASAFLRITEALHLLFHSAFRADNRSARFPEFLYFLTVTPAYWIGVRP